MYSLKMLMNIKEHSLSTMKINHEILEQHCTGFPTMRGGHEKRPVGHFTQNRQKPESILFCHVIQSDHLQSMF